MVPRLAKIKRVVSKPDGIEKERGVTVTLVQLQEASRE